MQLQSCTEQNAESELPNLKLKGFFFANFIFRIVLGLMYQINTWD